MSDSQGASDATKRRDLEHDGPPILVATDLAPSAADALLAGRARSILTGAALIVCHVMPDDSLRYAPLMPHQHHVLADDVQALAAGQSLRAQVRACTALPDHAYRLHLERGVPSNAILHLADTLGAGLIIVGHGSESMVTRALLGSTTEDLARRAPMSLLVVRPGRPYGPIVATLALDGTASRAGRAATREAAMRGAKVVTVLDEDPVEIAATVLASLIIVDGSRDDDDPVEMLRRARCSMLILRGPHEV
ncbi:MAG: universal stress protein [Polyangiaceae bacterium]